MGPSEIRDAMQRLSHIANRQCCYDAGGDLFGDGPIHYLVEVGHLVFMAWESNDSGLMVVNPITRFDLDGLDELGAEEAWTILRMPTGFTEGIQFREIANEELAEAYHRMEEWGRENSCLKNQSLVNA